ncbi:GLE1, putative [Babesia ovis]|uniref:mRNA export factor GLE1 n=1 Tax=Babesia ovis TaxID=5869 RepID=A0A9W5TEQ7_BABOV|nr:GLE1, putative [Babesia ovis]
MYRESLSRRRGTSFTLYDQVFCGNRALVVPPSTVSEISNTVHVHINTDSRVLCDVAHVPDDWEPAWLPFDHLDNAIERSIHSSSQMYVNLLNDALAEVTKLDKVRAKNLEAQKQAAKLAEDQAGTQTKSDQRSQENPESNKETQLSQQGGSDSTTKNGNGIPSTSDGFHGENNAVSVTALGPQFTMDGIHAGGSMPRQSDDGMMPAVEELKPYCPRNKYTENIDNYESEYENLRREYDAYAKNTDPRIKQIRIDIARKINTTVNKLANTQKQVNHSYNTLVEIKNQYQHEPSALVYLTFRVIETVLDLCEPGGQMYLNPKAVWASAHLIRGMLTLHPSARAIYLTLVKRSCPYAVPRLYEGTDPTELEKLHGCTKRDVNTYLKKQTAVVRFHLALMVVTVDIQGLWAWFAGFLNGCTKNVFRLPLSGVISTALTTAAHLCLQSYKQQFVKVLAVCEDMFKRGRFMVPNCEAAEMYHEHISHFFNEYRKTGTLDPPEGSEMKECEADIQRDW